MLYDLRRHFYNNTSKRVLPDWNMMLNSLNYQRNELQRRHMLNYGADSRCVGILKHMCGLLDMEYLTSMRNDFDRYLNYMRFIKKVLDGVFNPAKTGRAYRKAFYTKKVYSTSEYLCPVDDVDHLSFLPFDKPWEYWKQIKPVTLWYHDSKEYTLNLLKDQVEFSYVQPTYAVIFIDAVTLGFKYFKYMTSDLPEEGEKTLHNFVHRHVMNLLYPDLQEIWLTNEIIHCSEQMLQYEDTLNVDELTETLTNVQYGYRTQKYKEAIDELVTVLTLVKKGNLRVSSFLSSDVYPNNKSIVTKINDSFKYLDIEHISQLKFMELFRDLPMLLLITNLYALCPNEYYKSYCRDVRVLLNRAKSSQFWNTFVDSNTAYKVKDIFTSIEKKILF